MVELNKKEIEMIRKKVAKEFPDDPALQQIHIARKIIAREAKLKGLSFTEYVRSLVKQVVNA
jgi:cobalamin biosynthesis Co2+ chelatase CbiK